MSNQARRTREKPYEHLSPFELKDKLIAMASSESERMMLNAGRGNPNWFATDAREAFFLLGNFAMQEGRRVMSRFGLAGSPHAQGVAGRWREFCHERSEHAGAQFLLDALNYAVNDMGLDANTFAAEMVDALIGDHYPVPDRVLPNVEKVVRRYLALTMCGGEPPAGTMDLFVTEGGTAAMTYIFNTLRENGLLNPGDTIALGTPIFTPYLEIPHLNDYRLVVIEVEMDENNNWQYPDTELDKLADPAVKAFFLVNPSNPPSVSIAQASLDKIAALTAGPRKDLIILTDDVYGTFVDNFRSLYRVAPRNTILVYSYSKYFGATGWRLGVIGIQQDNVLDEMLAAQPEEQRAKLRTRYASIATDPDSLKIIDRMLSDSRAVALHHTAGLSTPQQVMMTLFSLQELLDSGSLLYRKEVRDILRERYELLYAALGVKAPELPSYAMYYTTIDIPALAEKHHGPEFRKWLVAEHEPIDFVWRLADEKGVVLMDGGGFDAPRMSVRVSLANLSHDDYTAIGTAMRELLAQYHAEWPGVQG